MTGAAAYKIWQRAVLATDDCRVQAARGLPQGYDRFCAQLDVLLALKMVLIEAVTEREEGALGLMSRELTLMQNELVAPPTRNGEEDQGA